MKSVRCGIPVLLLPAFAAAPLGKGAPAGPPDLANLIFHQSNVTGRSILPTNGAATPAGPLRFVPVSPCRIADTRNPNGPFGGPKLAAGGTRDFAIPDSGCGIPSVAAAYSLNVTAVPDEQLGYLTIWPSDQPQPLVSTLNSDGRAKANAAIVAAGSNGAVSVFATDSTQLIVDIDGYFEPAGTSAAELQFYPVTPCRVADTRQSTGPFGGPFLSGGAAGRSFPMMSSACNVPALAQAYSLNVTAVPHGPLGYITVWPAGQNQPMASTLNASTGAPTSNAAIVASGSGGAIQVYVSDDTDLVIDINGYFAPPGTTGLDLFTVSPCRVLDTRNIAGSLPFSGVMATNVAASSCMPQGSSAQAFVLNATAVPSGSLGLLTLWPDGLTQPMVSTLNALDGATMSNMAIVATVNGSIDAFATDPTQLILDISAWFAPSPVQDWPQFGWDVSSSGSPPGSTGITAANVSSLVQRRVQLDGTVDASAIYLHGVTVNGSNHDVFFVTTTYGKTIAVDADAGSVLWEYTPPGFAGWVGTAQITNSTPAADPDRQNIYAAAPDGTVEKLAIADGHVVWSTAITLLPTREKITSPLKVYGGRVIAVTGGYAGDAPPYQGHVAILDAQTGTLQHVWNSLCSDQAGLLQPQTCNSQLSAIWGRAGAVIDPVSGNIFVATGNGPWNGQTDWGDSVIELDPDATTVLANYTPADNATLDADDADLGSTSPVLLDSQFIAQGGKDAQIRTLNLTAIAGAAPNVGNESQSISTPSNSMLFTAPAVWRNAGMTWLFAADGGATAAWTVTNGQLQKEWSNSTAGTSPIVAGGLLYVYDPNGALNIYNPADGTAVANLTCGPGHWNSPIVADGRIALPEGNANQHATAGVLNIWAITSP